MRFWDASAVVPLVVQERATGGARTLLRVDPGMVVWWATEVECASAICRRGREGTLTREGVTRALGLLDGFRDGWSEVEPSEEVRRAARRLLRTHPVRAADALQVGAALAAAGSVPDALPFVCLDRRLADAADSEGLRVIVPG